MSKKFLSVGGCILLSGAMALSGCGSSQATPGDIEGTNDNTVVNEKVTTDVTPEVTPSDTVTVTPEVTSSEIPPVTPDTDVTDSDKADSKDQEVTPVILPVVDDVEEEREELPEPLDFVRNLELGWNLGNTFDASSDTNNGMNLEFETYWCKAKTTPEMFDTLKEAGFKSVRIPVSWHDHVDDEFNINSEWMERVAEVVDYAIDRDMYVIINSHHDIDKRYCYPSAECLDNSKKYMGAIWSQIADRFADYDDHLLFESMNEPRLKGTGDEWNYSGNAATLEAAGCINELNQLVVDTVRSKGGNNASRYIVVPGYAAAYQAAIDDAFVLPTDTVADRLIVEVHGYIPGSFALTAPEEPNSAETFSSLNSVNTGDVNSFMFKLKKNFTDKGIPVVLDEFGARDKNHNIASRADYCGYFVKTAREFRITCFLWDNNSFSGSGENFGLLNRKENRIEYPEIAKALVDNCR